MRQELRFWSFRALLIQFSISKLVCIWTVIKALLCISKVLLKYVFKQIYINFAWFQANYITTNSSKNNNKFYFPTYQPNHTVTKCLEIQ